MIPEKSLWIGWQRFLPESEHPAAYLIYRPCPGNQGQIRDPMPVSPRMAAMSRPPHADADGSAHAPCKTYPQVEGKEGKCSHHHKAAAGRNSRNEITSGITGFTQMQSVSTAVKVQAVRQNSRSENFPI